MQSRTAQINLKVDQTGNAAKSMKDMEKTTRDVESTVRDMTGTLTRSETEYQRRLEKTISLLKERGRLEKDVRERLDREEQSSLRFPGASAVNRAGGQGGGSGGLVGAARGLLGGKGGGSLGGLGGGLGAGAGIGAAIVAGVAIVGKAAGEVAKFGEILQNSQLTSAQKSRAMSEQLPLGIGTFAKNWNAMQDMLHGVNEGLRKVELGFGRKMVNLEGASAEQIVTNSYGNQINEQRNRAAAYTKLAGTIQAPPGIDRSTFQGEIAYGEQQRRLPHQDAQARAQAEVDAARKTAQQAQTTLNQLQTQRARQAGDVFKGRMREREVIRNEEFFGGPGNPMGGGLQGREQVARQQTGRESQLAEEAHDRTSLAIGEQIKSVNEANANLAQKESEARRAGIAAAREELSILREREQALKGQAQRVGGLSVMGRRQGLMAARLVKQAGGDLSKLAPEVIQAAEQFAPEYINKVREQFGQGTEEYKQGQKEGFLREGDIKGTQAKIDKIQTDVRVDVALDTAQLAKEIADALNAAFRELIDKIKAETQNKRSKFETGLNIRNNAVH